MIKRRGPSVNGSWDHSEKFTPQPNSLTWTLGCLGRMLLMGGTLKSYLLDPDHRGPGDPAKRQTMPLLYPVLFRILCSHVTENQFEVAFKNEKTFVGSYNLKSQ